VTLCKYCGNTVTNGIHLSDGGAIHDTCLSMLEEQKSELENTKFTLEDKVHHFTQELKKRERITFKLSSLFSKPSVDSEEIHKVINSYQSQSKTISRQLSKTNVILSSYYDYYLTYPPDWRERKEQVIHRDGQRCRSCGSGYQLHLHHLKPLSKGGSNQISNLVLLCEACHSKEHHGRDFTGEFTEEETAFSKRVADIRYAIDHEKYIDFGYRKPDEKGFTKRRVRPVDLVNLDHRRDHGSTLCVRGFCELRQADRIFALKRMRGLKVI